eukprot:GFUD01065651.1.p1 GENE.GFUD01065651.1~~GFUD01065651.1.p1  ORF type:complete len:120 (-),score=8.95 GFUD01065651.1:25-384(-)
MTACLVLTMIVLSLAIKQTSLCNSDSQCPKFRRGQFGATLTIFGQQVGNTIVSGRCLTRSNIFCNLGNIFGGGRRNCNYRECAQCLENSDCRGYDQYCSGNTCNTRTQTNPNNGIQVSG